MTTIETMEEEGLVDDAARMGERAMARLTDMMDRSPAIGDARGRGLLMGIEPVEDRDSRAPANDLSEEVRSRAAEGGMSFKVSMGNVLILTLPLTVTADDIDRARDIIVKTAFWRRCAVAARAPQIRAQTCCLPTT